MADRKASAAPAPAAGTRSGGGFELRLERGGAYLRLAGQPIAPGLELESLTLQVPDVKFPFDVGAGSAQFRHRLADLVELSVTASPSIAEPVLAAAGLAAFGVEAVRLAAREGFLELAGRLSGGPPFTMKAGLLPADEHGLRLVFYSPRILGPSPLPAAALPHYARAVVDAPGEELVPKDPLGTLLRRVLAGRGWKVPRITEIRLARAEIAAGVVRFGWDRAAAGPAVASADPELLAADEGARAFREAEAHVASGDLAAAREAYLAAGTAATSHPFGAERLLSLLALEDRFHEEALDLAAEWLARRPGFAPALATEAAVRLARNEGARAAHALAALAQVAANRGEGFTALAASEAAFTIPDAARGDAMAAVETALGLRRDHVPALRALRDLARAAGDREANVRANRRLIAYDLDPASKARAHAELGELLLEADPPAARLHLDQALRLAPDDPEALAALAKACAAAGEPLRAVRALDRLRELQLSSGDHAGASRAALEAGALWEGPLGHVENALLRYREACELDPTADAHARTARAAEKAGQWAEAADHHTVVLSKLDLSAPSGVALAVQTRIALAEIAEKHLLDRAGAAAHLEAASALAPGDVELLRRLVAVARTLGWTASVAPALERLAALEPKIEVRAALLAEAGEAILALGRPSEARSRFAAAIASLPTCRPALLGLADLARQSGDAAAERDALLRLAPLAHDATEGAEIQDRLASASERAGDLVRALAAAKAARGASPSPVRLETALRLVRLAGSPGELAALLAERARTAQAEGDRVAATGALLERAQLLAVESPSLALAALAEARATSPGDAAVLRAQADLAERAGDRRLALDALRALLLGDPSDAPALEARAARAALAAGESAAAREHAERALTGGAGEASDVLDEVLDRSGDDGERAEVLARVGRHLEAARLFESRGDTERACAALERAAQDPALAREALERLANLRLSSGDHARAAAALLALARVTPGVEGASIALRAHALGQDPAALDVAIDHDPTSTPARAKRAALRVAEDPHGALADAEAALAGRGLEEDERTGMLSLAARAASAAGDRASARRHLTAYCEAIPDDDDALSRLAALHRAAGAKQDLARVLARRIELVSGAEAASVRVELSDLLVSSDPARAARLALDALVRDPASTAALRALSTAPRAAQVPPAEREGVIRCIVAGKQTPPEKAVARARFLAEAGDAKGALESAQEAARLGLQEDDALDLRAMIAARTGNAPEAARVLLARAGRAAERADPFAAEQLAEAGLVAVDAGVDGGEEALRRALESEPERETARAVLEVLAGLARKRGDSAGERQALSRLAPLLPTVARSAALLRHASLALAAGDQDDSRESAEEALALTPLDPAAAELCRAAALADGDLVRVAELLGDLASLEPDTAGPRLLERARLLASMGEAEEADHAFAAALPALPPDPALADEHARHRREQLAGRDAAQPLEAFARRTDDARAAAVALRAGAATAWAGGDRQVALRCARRAYARTQADLAFAAPLLARLLYLAGGGAEALVLHRRLLEAEFPGVGPEESVALCRQAAELADDAGERSLALQAYDKLLALRPQELDAALRRFELDRDRGRAVRDLAAAADSCRSRDRRARALARAAEVAVREVLDHDLGDGLFRRALEDAAPEPALTAEITRSRAAAVRAVEGASSPGFLAALHDEAAAAQATGDRARARALLEEAVDLERERALFAEAAHDILQLDALAAAEGDFAESAARIRSAGALLREAGDLPAAAEVLHRAWQASPESVETARLLEEVVRALGPPGLPTLLELLADRAARAPAGEERAEALVALADARAGDPGEAEAALRSALTEAPGHAGAEDRLLAMLAGAGRSTERARVLLDRAERARDDDYRNDLRRTAAGLLAVSAEAEDRTLAAEIWDALAKTDPADLDAARAAAGLLIGLGRRPDAVPHLAAMVKADPDDQTASRELSGAYADRNRERGGLFLSRAERASNEERAANLREAGRAFFAAGDDERGQQALRDAFEAWPDGAAFNEALREAAVEIERTDAVLLARAEAVPSEAAACHRARADALQAFGETERAIGAYEAALAVEPRDVDSLSALAGCVAAARGEGAAREHDLGVVSLCEATPPEFPGVTEAPSRYRLGLALFREGDLAGATPHLERALAIAPADPRAWEARQALSGHATGGEEAPAIPAATAPPPGRQPEPDRAAADTALTDEAVFPSYEGAPSADAFFDVLRQPEPEPELEPEPAFADTVELSEIAEISEIAEPSATAGTTGEAAEAEDDPAAQAAAFAATAEALSRGGAPDDEIRAALDRACEADPDSPAPWQVTARIQVARHQPVAAARAHLSVSIRSEGEEAVRAALEAASLFEDVGRHADALRAYRAALHAKPGCVPPPTLLAEEALATGDAAAAVGHLSGFDTSALPPEAAARHARKLARALDAAGRGEQAADAWAAIFHGSPGDAEAFSRTAAHALASRGLDAWAELAAEHEEALAASGEPERWRDLRHERARLYAEAGWLEAARGEFLAALEIDPGHFPTIEALSALDARRDDWANAAAALGEEASQTTEGAEAAAVYLRQARILSDRLEDGAGAISTLRAALTRARGDGTPAGARCAAEAEARLAELGASPEKVPPEAPQELEPWLELARSDPADPRALAGIAETCKVLARTAPGEAAARAAERGRIAESLAAFVVPDRVQPPRGKVAARIRDDLRVQVAVPGTVGSLARLLRLLAPWLEPLFPADLGRCGAAPTDRLSPSRSPVLARALRGAARALSTRTHTVLVTSREGVDIALENTQPPSVIASAGLAGLSEAALSFVAARTLDLLDHAWALAGKFSPKDFGILLELACRFAGGAPPGLGLPAERAGAFIKVLRAQVPAATRSAAEALGVEAARELGKTDPRAFAAALRRTANHVALLYAGDPGPALHALALLDRRLEAGAVDPREALALPDLRDLALFALSEPFLDLRKAALG